MSITEMELANIQQLIKTGGTENIELGLILARRLNLLEEILEPFIELDDLAFDTHNYNILIRERRYRKLSEISDLISEDNSPIVVDRIRAITKIKELSLRGHKLKSLPDSIDLFVNLTSLDLRDNELTKIPKSIGNLSKMYRIGFSNNQLTTLPESIGNFKELVGLEANNNQITNIPQSIGGLTHLTDLFLANNRLRSLPESIGQLKSLRNFDVNYNRLTSIPESINGCVRLFQFEAVSNQLTSLPQSFGELSSLSRLLLFDNPLKNFPKPILQLKGLTWLALRKCQLTIIPETIGQLKNIGYLDLNGNQLTQIPESIGDLKRLTDLDLEDNELEYLPESLASLPKLKWLDISGNWIRSLKPIRNRYIRAFIFKLPSNDLVKLSEVTDSLIQSLEGFFWETRGKGITDLGNEIDRDTSADNCSKNYVPSFADDGLLIRIESWLGFLYRLGLNGFGPCDCCYVGERPLTLEETLKKEYDQASAEYDKANPYAAVEYSEMAKPRSRKKAKKRKSLVTIDQETLEALKPYYKQREMLLTFADISKKATEQEITKQIVETVVQKAHHKNFSQRIKQLVPIVFSDAYETALPNSTLYNNIFELYLNNQIRLEDVSNVKLASMRWLADFLCLKRCYDNAFLQLSHRRYEFLKYHHGLEFDYEELRRKE